jgi:hypothetical protein
MNPTLISVLSAVAAAAWSIWTWRSDREKERELRRDEMSAQYTNAFIVVMHEFQKLLYSILEENELARANMADGAEAVSSTATNLLYHFSMFFGWSNIIFRFGPYTRNPHVIAQMARIGDLLETRDEFQGEAFRFSPSERLALGEVALLRVGEANARPSFMSITRFQFEEELHDEHGRRSRLFKSRIIRSTIEAMDRAGAGEALEGRERLAALQNVIVDLISYLEETEGFHVSVRERRRARSQMHNKCAEQLMNGAASIVHQVPGRLRLRIEQIRDNPGSTVHIRSLLESLAGVTSVRINIDAACAVVHYAKDTAESDIIDALIGNGAKTPEKVVDKIKASTQRALQPRTT